MSRSGYSCDLEPLELGRYRRQVQCASLGKRGQQFFRDLVAALDALPEKRLIKEEIQRTDGEVCALGAVGKLRGLPAEKLNEYVRQSDNDALGREFNIARQLAAETQHENDEGWYNETPENRWARMRAWAVENIVPEKLKEGG